MTQSNRKTFSTQGVRLLNGKGALRDRLKAYGIIHAHDLISSLGRQMRSPFTTLLTMLVLSIAVSFAAGFYIFVSNAQQLTGNLQATNQISVYLKHQIDDEQGMLLAGQIERLPDVQSVGVISKETALKEFQSFGGFGNAVSALDENPLPVVIQVFPDHTGFSSEKIEKLIGSIKKMPEVDFAQADMQWVQRLQSITDIARRSVLLISILLAAAVVFITGNTIRLELQNRRDEVIIARLVGATDAFIRRPFLYSGFWYGFFSGLIAWLIVTLMTLALSGPVKKLSELYAGGHELVFFSGMETLALIAFTSLMGIAGSWVVLSFQLQQLKPE